MGTIRKGALGGFSGKAGSIIGSSWRDIDYIKGLHKKSNKPKTQNQLEQQAKFALAARFMRPVKNQVSVGFAGIKKGQASAYNMAIKNLLYTAIIGVFPDFEIDYPNVSFSVGGLSRLDNFAVVPGPLSLGVTWSNVTMKTTSLTSDVFHALVHDPVSGDFVTGPPSIERGMGTAEIALPSDWLGREVHAYFYFVTPSGKDVSPTSYGGAFTVI